MSTRNHFAAQVHDVLVATSSCNSLKVNFATSYIILRILEYGGKSEGKSCSLRNHRYGEL